jgi:hypothetical protein
LLEQLGVVDVDGHHDHAQRTAVGLDDHTAFGALFRAIRGVGTDMVPPKRALPIAPSALCQRQSTPPNSSQFSTSVAQIRFKTPFCTYRWKVRWTEESSPNDGGRWFHWPPRRIW